MCGDEMIVEDAQGHRKLVIDSQNEVIEIPPHECIFGLVGDQILCQLCGKSPDEEITEQEKQ